MQPIYQPIYVQPIQYPVHVPTQFSIYNDVTKCLNTLPPTSVQFDAITKLAVAPVGYTCLYVYTPEVRFNAMKIAANAAAAAQTTCNLNNFNNVSPSTSVSSGNTSVASSSDCNQSAENSRETTPEVTESDDRKFQHKSKQTRIQQVYNDIKEYFTAEGVYAASEKSELRGMDTCRVHVKNFAGLNKILDILKEVHSHPKIKFLRIATPISKKNAYQNKGFIVYMKVVEESMVPFVQQVFAQYSNLFKKCDIAKTREQTALEKAQKLKAATTVTKPVKATPLVKYNKMENHTAILNTKFLSPHMSVNKVSGKTVTINGLVARRRVNMIAPAC